jgi:glycosyltransferase involved in cell wall biosynthesis
MSLLEGGAVGALCVATRVGGIPEIIKDGETGFLVPPESVEELANALLLALNLDSDIAFETRRALQATVRARFSLPHSAAKYVQLFESLLPRALQTKTNVT